METVSLVEPISIQDFESAFPARRERDGDMELPMHVAIKANLPELVIRA